VRADRKQVLRSRACRALAQDDNAAMRRGGTKGEFVVPPLHICGEGDRG